MQTVYNKIMQTTHEIYNNTILPLPESDKLEIASLILRSVTSERSKRRVSAAEFLKELPRRTFRIAAEADESLRLERDSWDG